MKDLSRNVTMFCDVCGNDQFSTLDEIISPDSTNLGIGLRTV